MKTIFSKNNFFLFFRKMAYSLCFAGHLANWIKVFDARFSNKSWLKSWLINDWILVMWKFKMGLGLVTVSFVWGKFPFPSHWLQFTVLIITIFLLQDNWLQKFWWFDNFFETLKIRFELFEKWKISQNDFLNLSRLLGVMLTSLLLSWFWMHVQKS